MYDTDLEFQSIFFLAYGILFGGLSSSLLVTMVFLLLYEYYVFQVSQFYPPGVKYFDRIFVNIIFIFGWILGRVLILNETGFEEISDALWFEK